MFHISQKRPDWNCVRMNPCRRVQWACAGTLKAIHGSLSFGVLPQETPHRPTGPTGTPCIISFHLGYFKTRKSQS